MLLLVTFSFPCFPIKLLLVHFLKTKPAESSRVCVCFDKKKEKEELHKGSEFLPADDQVISVLFGL